MEKPTKILSDEHKNILKVIEALAKECDRLGAGVEIDKDFFKKAIDFIKNYADKFHHAKEEDILFKELDKRKEKMNCSPMDQMRHEHDLGRGFVKGLETALNGGNKEKVIENARGYAELLEDHIYKEDNILYPMADGVLDEATQKEITEKFAKISAPDFNNLDFY
ncbi:MAG: hemerythrin domain-containing protein [Patescibacteria group bacterium]